MTRVSVWGGLVVAVAVLVGLFVVGGGDNAQACSSLPSETVEFVIGRLTGEEEPSSGARIPLGAVRAVVERETVRTWDAIEMHTAASALVATRYWGETPSGSLLAPEISGAEPKVRPAVTTSCGPSLAKPLGSRDLVAVFEESGFVPLTPSELTPEQEAMLTQYLGEPQAIAQPDLPEDHPQAISTDTDTTPEPANRAPWLYPLVGLALLGIGTTIALRRRRPATRG